MSISLTKGQKISLTKEGGAGLASIAVGLGWGKATKTSKGFFGFGGGARQEDVDLDASCLLYDASSNVIDTIWWRNLRSDDGSILHTGDDLTGGGADSDPNEVINVDLQSVAPNVKSIIFVVNSYSGETFKGIPFAFCNVVDGSSRKEIARYNLATDGGDYRGFIIAKVYRHGGEWKFHAIGEQCTGRAQTIQEIEPQSRTFA